MVRMDEAPALIVSPRAAAEALAFVMESMVIGKGLDFGRLGVVQRLGVIVPGAHSREDAQRTDNRLGKREHNLEEDRVFAGAVDARGLKQRLGNGLEVGVEDDDVVEAAEEAWAGYTPNRCCRCASWRTG